MVGLGALGMITSLELAVEPAFRVRQQVFEDLRGETRLLDFDAVSNL